MKRLSEAKHTQSKLCNPHKGWVRPRRSRPSAREAANKGNML